MKSGFKKGFAVARETMKTRRYQSKKQKVAFEEYAAFCAGEEGKTFFKE